MYLSDNQIQLIMKQLTTLLITTLLLTAYHAGAQSCCKKPAGNSMQALALTKSFKAAHEAPLPINYAPEKGTMIQFPVTGGPDGNAFYVPADVPANKVLFIFHEWWGLNDYIKREAENWQKMLGGKVDVYAIDLYDGKVATMPDEAGKLASGLNAKRGESIVSGLLHKIGGNKKVATLGWCMGGSWSFTAIMLAGTQAAGCVMYYGFPEKDFNRIKTLKCDVLYIRGSQDNFIKKSDVEEFEKQVQKTGHNITMYSFDAPHAFANPSNPKYDAKSAAEAQKYALDFLKDKLSVK
jgi:carboxymethylenebutenolidase